MISHLDYLEHEKYIKDQKESREANSLLNDIFQNTVTNDKKEFEEDQNQLRKKIKLKKPKKNLNFEISEPLAMFEFEEKHLAGK